MTEAPERLNISKSLGGQWVAFNDGCGEDYIRADLVDAQDAAWSERVAALEAAVAAARAEGVKAALAHIESAAQIMRNLRLDDHADAIAAAASDARDQLLEGQP